MSELRWFTLGEVTVNHDSRRVPVRAADRTAGPYPYYGASGVVDSVSDFIFDGTYLLIAEDGENLRTRKTPIAFIASGKFWVNNHAHVVQGNQLASTHYLAYVLSRTDISGYLSGSTQPKLTQDAMNRVRVLLPERSYQDAVVEVLRALDGKIESNILAIQTANELAGAIFEAVFEQPESTELVQLGDLADVIDCLHSQKPQFAEGGHRYLVLADIRDDSRLAPVPSFTISSDDYIEWTRRIEAREGDCLLTNVGRVGAVGQIPHGVTAAIGRNMTAIRGRIECPPAYLAEALRSATVRREIDVKTDQGTVMSALNVRSIPDLLIPAANTQDRQIFQDRVGGLHELQDQLLRENADLAIMRDTLLPKLMSGEIRVCEAEQIVEDAT